MASIEVFRPYYTRRRAGQRVSRICMDDRLRRRGIQTPGEVAGQVSDANMCLELNGITADAGRLTSFVIKAAGLEQQHKGVCGGRKALPDVPHLIATTDPGELIDGVGQFELGIPADTVLRFIEVARKMKRRGITFAPDTGAARKQLRAEGIVVPSRPVDAPGPHRADFILANSTDLEFNPAAAQDDGNPAYNIDFARATDDFATTLSGLAIHPDNYTAILAIRSYVTAKDQLPPGASGQPLQILAHKPSLARDDR